MTSGIVLKRGSESAQIETGTGWRALPRNAENMTVVMALALTALLPVLEIVLRPLQISIPGSIVLVRHLTLVIGMLGGALAAREGRLLSISTVTTFLKGRARTAARLFSGSVAAAVTAFLAAASFQFVMQKREASDQPLLGIPIWIFLAALPLGFSAITIRLLRQSGETRPGRWISWPAALLLVLLAFHPPVAVESMLGPAFLVLLLATLLGAPVYVMLGGAALIGFWSMDLPITALAIDYASQSTSTMLPAIPLFTLAGYLLAEGGASKRLVSVFHALVGHMRGGPAIAAVLVCAFFTSFTGASGVTILALGPLLLPVLRAADFGERDALGLLTGSGSLGLLWPPCLPMIFFAIVAQTITMQQMFLGGILPGTLLVALIAGWGILRSPSRSTAGQKFQSREAWHAVREAKWELLLPVVALTAIFGGFADPVEAAALTAVYALIVETFVYRDLNWKKDLPRVMAECGLLIGGVLLILGVALGFTDYLITAQIPDLALDWVRTAISSPLVFLLALNILLLIVGCLMDIYSAIVVVVPLIVPMGQAFGIHPVHLGIIFLANLELGYLTPPVGMNLFLSSYRFGKPMPAVMRSIVPVFLILLIGVLIITYVPALSTVLPQRFG